jgi:hypothetical protein
MATLGYPEPKNLPFVLVATGAWVQYNSDPPENVYLYGFLMEERGTTFKILSLDLDVQMFEKTPPGTEAHRKVGFEKLDLGKEARSFLSDQEPDANREKEPRKRVGDFFGPDPFVCPRMGLLTARTR